MPYADNPHTVSPNCTNLIKATESLRLTAYLCPTNKLTIGWGHVLLPKFDCGVFGITADHLKKLVGTCQKSHYVSPDIQKVLKINQGAAESFLARDVAQAALFVRSTTQAQLSQGQFDALVSFVFNVGQGNYATSTLKKRLAAGDYQGAADEFGRWVYGTDAQGRKVRLKGLAARREEERWLFGLA